MRYVIVFALLTCSFNALAGAMFEEPFELPNPLPVTPRPMDMGPSGNWIVPQDIEYVSYEPLGTVTWYVDGPAGTFPTVTFQIIPETDGFDPMEPPSFLYLSLQDLEFGHSSLGFTDGDEGFASVVESALLQLNDQLEREQCEVARVSFNRQRSPDDLAELLTVFVHCQDARNVSFTLRLAIDDSMRGGPRFGPPPVIVTAEEAFVVSPGFGSKGLSLPLPATPPGDAAYNREGLVFAYMGRDLDGEISEPVVTVAFNDANRNPVRIVQLRERPASFGSSVLICATEAAEHAWLAYLSAAGDAVMARVAGDNVRYFQMASNATSAAVDCDVFGNALGAWTTNSNVGYSLRESDGSMVEAQTVSSGNVSTAHVTLEASGAAAVAWNDGGNARVQSLQFDQPFVPDALLSGSYYNPTFNGEGFILEIVDVGGQPFLVIYYFTYDPDGSGRQRWAAGAGPLIGGHAQVDMVVASGATFGDAFDPAAVSRSSWGTIDAALMGCGLWRLQFNSPLFGSFGYIVEKFTPDGIGLTGRCSAGSTKGTATIDGSYGGSWSSADRDGEGLIMEVISSGGQPTLVVYWFTYLADGSGRQAWMVGSGPITGSTASVPLVRGTGGVYGENFDPDSVTLNEWGTLTVNFSGCASAEVVYDGPFGATEFGIERVTTTRAGVGGACAAR